MNWVKRAAGAVAAPVGAVGFALSAYAIVGAWSIADRLDRGAGELVGRLEEAVGAVEDQADRVVDVVGAAREHVGSIRDSVDQLSPEAEPGPLADASLLDSLDEDVAQWLETAEELVGSMQASLSNASGALLLLDSFPLFRTRLAPAMDRRESHLRTLAASLDELSGRLDQVMHILVEIRSRRSIDPRQLDRLRDALRLVDGQLGSIQSEVREFSGGIGEASEALTALERKVPRWVDAGAVLATVFFVCFGGSQLSLACQGWRCLASRSPEG